MPIYEFKCMMCNDIRIIDQSIHLPLEKQYCFKCKVEMARKYEPTGVVFNGTGWAGKSK